MTVNDMQRQVQDAIDVPAASGVDEVFADVPLNYAVRG
jgi:hypothetical protein